ISGPLYYLPTGIGLSLNKIELPEGMIQTDIVIGTYKAVAFHAPEDSFEGYYVFDEKGRLSLGNALFEVVRYDLGSTIYELLNQNGYQQDSGLPGNDFLVPERVTLRFFSKEINGIKKRVVFGETFVPSLNRSIVYLVAEMNYPNVFDSSMFAHLTRWLNANNEILKKRIGNLSKVY
ncbi:MAG: hypothetical protein ACAI44_19020, partial [Candidatus Sericytochromatia bacterium]